MCYRRDECIFDKKPLTMNFALRSPKMKKLQCRKNGTTETAYFDKKIFRKFLVIFTVAFLRNSENPKSDEFTILSVLAQILSSL